MIVEQNKTYCFGKGMQPNRLSLMRFFEKLPELCNSCTIEIERRVTPTEANWDSPARLVMKQMFSGWLQQELNLEQIDVEETLFVEGLFGNLYGINSTDFFGSKCCPDLGAVKI
jgi:hypothetical protein